MRKWEVTWNRDQGSSEHSRCYAHQDFKSRLKIICIEVAPPFRCWSIITAVTGLCWHSSVFWWLMIPASGFIVSIALGCTGRFGSREESVNPGLQQTLVSQSDSLWAREYNWLQAVWRLVSLCGQCGQSQFCMHSFSWLTYQLFLWVFVTSLCSV